MKHLALWTLLAGWMAAGGWAYAQTTYLSSAPPNITKAQVCARLNKQTAKVNADSKVGKMTTDQANQILASLQSIKAQIKADYVQNGNKTLTVDQISTVSGMLDQTGNNIHALSGLKDWTGK